MGRDIRTGFRVSAGDLPSKVHLKGRAGNLLEAKVTDQKKRQLKPDEAQKPKEAERKTQRQKSPDQLTTATQSFVAALAEAVEAKATGTDEPEVGTGRNIVTLKEGFDARDLFTGKASEITRQLGFAGLAIIWVFKSGQGTEYSVPKDLLLPALMLTVGLTLDFLHYVAAGALWQWFTKSAQKARKEEFDAPAWINPVTWTFFILKITAIVAAYSYLILFLARLFKETGVYVPNK